MDYIRVYHRITLEERDIDVCSALPRRLQCSSAVRDAHLQDHPDKSDDYVYRGPCPIWIEGIWGCGDWETPGPPRCPDVDPENFK